MTHQNIGVGPFHPQNLSDFLVGKEKTRADIIAKTDETQTDFCVTPENEKPVAIRRKRGCRPALRKTSYQKAMKESYPIPSSVIERSFGTTVPTIKVAVNSCEDLHSCADTHYEDYSSPLNTRHEDRSSPLNSSLLNTHHDYRTSTLNTSPLDLDDFTLERRSLSLPPFDHTEVNITRSVSFNDRLLDPPRQASEELCEPPNYIRGRSGSNSTPTSPIRRLLSTSGRVQATNNSSKSSSPEDGLGESQGKRAIKNLTFNFARRLSFGRKMGEQKPTRETNPQLSTTSDTLSLEDGIDSFESLLRLFECPGCCSLMSPPLLQCRKGHLVCEKCKVSFKGTCPVCKQRVTETTNYMMEQVCQLVRFPCQFVKFGCSESHSLKQKMDHENFCIFRPVSCHFENRGCDSVLPIKDMNAHISVCRFQLKAAATKSSKALRLQQDDI